jgi:hypothetical protein
VTGFIAEDNGHRTDAYRKDEVLEAALLAANLALEPSEPEIPAGVEPSPDIFVFGLPRSGTTLTHQVLAWGLDVGYISNVCARFWLAPYAGAMVSQAVLGDERDGSFRSDYAKTLTAAGGHEFAYFWHRWLAIDGLDDLVDFTGDSARADWPGAAAAVRRLHAAFGKPLLFKTNYAAQFMPAFARTFPMPLFVHVHRDPWRVALSMLEARRRYYGDTSVWWSTHPPDYRQLEGLSAADQIAGQIVSLRRAYAIQIAKVPPELVVEFSYDELCEGPGAIVDTVRRRCREAHGRAPELLHTLPDRFEPTPSRPPRTAEEEELAAALDRVIAQGVS